MLSRDQWDKSVQNGGKISPAGVGVKLSSLLCKYQNLHPWRCLVSSYCQNGLRRKKLKNFCFLAVPNLVWFCKFNSREQSQPIVCRGNVKSTCTFVLSYFLNFSASKGFSAGHYSDVNVDVLGRTMPEEEMFLVCWNLQVGADIYALFNRVVLSCSAGCLCKLWNSCEWWQQTLAGGDQRPFRRNHSRYQAPLSTQNNSKLSKKFIWDTSAEKESVRKIQCRNYDEGT